MAPRVTNTVGNLLSKKVEITVATKPESGHPRSSDRNRPSVNWGLNRGAGTKDSAYGDGSGPNPISAFHPRVPNQLEAPVATHLPTEEVVRFSARNASIWNHRLGTEIGKNRGDSDDEDEAQF